MKTKFLLLASLFLGLHITYAQTDTLYIKQNGFTIGKFNTKARKLREVCDV